MKKTIFIFLGVFALSGCMQNTTTTFPVEESPKTQVTFFDAVDAMKQRYLSLSQQLENGTYTQDAS